MFFFASVVFGIVAAILSVLYLKSREAAILASLAGKEETMVTVVVAKQDLQKGQKLSPGLFSARNIPGTYAHSNAITPANFDSIDGRFLVEDLVRGRALLSNFIDESFPVDFSDLIKKGRRAITVQVDEPTSIAGMMRPGNRIDIYVNIATAVVNYTTGAGLPAALQQAAQQFAAAGGTDAEIPGELIEAVGQRSPTDVILPVLQDVLVLATGREAYDDHLDYLGLPQRRQGMTFSSVTLDVSPEQAALLTLADDKGDLLGILRNRHDRDGADFTGITPFDLFSNATEMQKQAAMRKAAAEAGATIDENGNWVTADGTVIKKEDIVISENGTVTTKGGQLLGAKGISMNENGEYVDADGNVIPPDQLVFNADGTVTTKDEIMRAAGYTINENGDYVDADGNIIKKEDVKVLANGTVMTADGKVLSGPKVTVNKDGFIIAEDGTVMTADGKILTGVAVNENGEVVGPDGTVMKDANLTIAADGTVRDNSGNVIAGVSGSSLPPGFDVPEADEQFIQTGLPKIITLILGGSSQDGVAKTSMLIAQPVASEIPTPKEGK
jgi:pilus assembly protein CpaB